MIRLKACRCRDGVLPSLIPYREAETALRTAHIAFGNNDDFPGGQNHSCMHVDYLFHAPTMQVSFTDGSQRDLMVDGDLRI